MFSDMHKYLYVVNSDQLKETVYLKVNKDKESNSLEISIVCVSSLIPNLSVNNFLCSQKLI